MEPKIILTRRANLKKWVEVHGVPSKEKSYFSQLLTTGTFGERAARRIEKQYKMGEGYLDQPNDELPADEADEGRRFPELPNGSVLARVDARELYLLTLFRESDDRGQESMFDAGELSEKRSLVGIRRNKTK